MNYISSSKILSYNVLATIILCASVIRPGYADNGQISPSLMEFGITAISRANTETSSSNIKVSSKEFDAIGNFSKLDLSHGKLIIGGHYNLTDYKVDNLDADKKLHILEIPFTLLKQQDVWSYITRLSPGIHSDFEKLNGNDFVVTARFIATRKQSEQLSWVLGAAIDRSFGDTALYPILGARYSPNENAMFDLVFPRLNINYNLSSKTVIFWNLRPSGGKWNVEVDNTNREFNVTTDALRTAFGLEANIFDHGWLKVEVGREINRSIELVNKTGSQFDLDFNDATFAAVRFIYRL